MFSLLPFTRSVLYSTCQFTVWYVISWSFILNSFLGVIISVEVWFECGLYNTDCWRSLKGHGIFLQWAFAEEVGHWRLTSTWWTQTAFLFSFLLVCRMWPICLLLFPLFPSWWKQSFQMKVIVNCWQRFPVLVTPFQITIQKLNINCKCSAHSTGLLLANSMYSLPHGLVPIFNNAHSSCFPLVYWLLQTPPFSFPAFSLVLPPNLILFNYWPVSFFVKPIIVAYIHSVKEYCTVIIP